MASGSPTSPRLVLTLVAVLLAGGFAIRVWSATHQPHPGRFFDERYCLDNVASMLREGRPANGFYLALCYLPQSALLATSEAVHRATGVKAFAIWTPGGDRFSPTTYVLCRTLNAIAGLAGLGLAFLIGRRLWSPAAGLLAVSALAATPRHLRSSVEFKPDIWVVLFTLLAFWWALAAVERPIRRRFLRAGLATGLAVSAKYTGVGAAFPVAIAGLARGGWRQPRRWGWLVLAAGVAVLTFVVLNPYLGLILPYGPRSLGAYERFSERQGLSHWTVLLRAARYFADNLGVVVAALAVGGALLVAWRAVRLRRAGGEAPLGELMALAQIVAYSLAYAAATPLFHGQNFLPLMPFACLLAALAATTAASRALAAVPLLARLSGLVLALVVGLSLAVQGRRVYAEIVPSTWAAAGPRLALEVSGLAGRQLVVEAGAERLSWRSQRRALVLRFDHLPSAPAALLEGADAEVFPATRLSGPDAREYERRRQATPPAGRHLLKRRPFAIRGQPLVLLVHSWEAVAVGAWSRPRGDAVLRLPAIGERERLSVEVRMRNGSAPVRLRLEPEGRELRLYTVDDRGAVIGLQTPRFAAGAGAVARLGAGRLPAGVLAMRAVRWRRGPAPSAGLTP